LILVAFFLPFSIYLFVLGTINRGRYPVMVSGVTDFIGVLFAASGFLLFGGPAILSGLSERWRLFWLLGYHPGTSNEGFWQIWVFLSVLYFFVIVGGAAFFLRNQRSVTSIYNIEAGLVERCLLQVCEQLGLDPARSGNMFVFGVEPAAKMVAVAGEGIQSAPGGKPHLSGTVVLDQTAILEIETFLRMRHVTLRWDPAAWPLRRDVETELQKVLSQSLVEPSELGAWLTMISVTLFGLTVIAGLTLLAIRLLG